MTRVEVMNKPLLRFGSRGADVILLQQALNAALVIKPELETDGIFGSKTNAHVHQFQGNSHLSVDGIVGPLTWGALAPFIDGLTTLVTKIVSPADEMAARQRIVATANLLNEQFKWDGKISETNPRIAGKYCCNPKTRLRQGGAQLTAIFSIAGVANAQKCLTISREAELMYQRKYTARERNAKDIVSWCGIFAAYVYKIAGLKISGWPLKYYLFSVKPEDQLRVLGGKEIPKIGDIGVIDARGGRNHHFVIVGISNSLITSVDGNAGLYMEIVKKINGYTVDGVKKHDGYFLTPIWDRVLT